MRQNSTLVSKGGFVFKALMMYAFLLAPLVGVAQLNLSLTHTDVACAGDCTGSATVTATGGTAPYTYYWNTTETTATAVGLCGSPGGQTYDVTVTDANGLTAVEWAMIFSPSQLSVTASGSSQICDQMPDGSASAVPAGGVPPYTYLWSNGGTAAQITGLAQGSYTVTVTDANGCTSAATATVDFWNEGIWLMDSVVNISCPGANDGFIHISAMSGTPPYSYNWNTGATGADLFNLGPGNYIVTVSDQNGCSNQLSVFLTQPAAINVTETITNTSCGNSSGSISLTATGGTGALSYQWSNGSTNPTIVNLSAGSYSVTVTDANGCSVNRTYTVIDNGGNLSVQANVDTQATCNTGGSASAVASNGSGNYMYMWSNGQNTQVATNLNAGNYTVTVVDSNTGCTGTATATINQAAGPVVTVTLDAEATCAVGGSATATVSGTGPYTYVWDNGQTTATATNLSAGPHSVTVTDAAGCSKIGTIMVTQTSGPMANASVISNASCTVGGTATVNATGGVTPYTYFWSNGVTDATASDLSAGSYTVTVTDQAGCTAVDMVTIQGTPMISVSITSSSDATCDQMGVATAMAFGGTGTVTYAWSNGETTATASNLPEGTYTVTVTDQGGCTAETTVSIGLQNNGINIGDYVWYDTNQDGFQHPNETNGVENVTVQLIKVGPDGLPATADDIIVGTEVTDATGHYLFSCVTPGVYFIQFSNIPTGYQWTQQDAVNDDCDDSDADADGITRTFTVVQGQGDDLCHDAGIHQLCDPLNNGGRVAQSQTICEGETPTLFYNVQFPSGGSGAIEYLWLQLIQNNNSNPVWSAVPGGTSPDLQVGPLYVTTHFMRCARRQGCPTYLESNILTVTVLPAGDPSCGNFLTNFHVNSTPSNSIEVNWTAKPEFSAYNYFVERSSNAATWTNIGMVVGAQNANSEVSYSYEDMEPLGGMNFYRIRRVDENDQEVLSNAASVMLDVPLKSSIRISPNPVNDVLNVSNIVKFDSEVTIEIIDLTGKIIQTLNIAPDTYLSQQMSTKNMAAGIYGLRIRFGNGEVVTSKLLKY